MEHFDNIDEVAAGFPFAPALLPAATVERGKPAHGVGKDTIGLATGC